MVIKFDNLPQLVNDEFYPFLFDETQTEVFVGGASSGKCFGKGTELVMCSGELKKVEDIKKGDLLMGPDSTPRVVISDLIKGTGELFKVTQNQGKEYIVNKHHILCLKRAKGCTRYSNEYVEISIEDYLKKSARWKQNYKGYKTQVEFPKKDVLIDPYFLGLWLGDGSQHTVSITTMDKDISDYIYHYAESLGEQIHVMSKKDNKASSYFFNGYYYNNKVKEEVANILSTEIKGKSHVKGTVRFIADYTGLSSRTIYAWMRTYEFIEKVQFYKNNPKPKEYDYIKNEVNKAVLRDKFKFYDLLYNKHIPDEYLYNDTEVRIQLLAGLLDTDGYFARNMYSITQKNELLARQIYYLANSLGFRSFFKKVQKTCCNNGEVGDYYIVNISGRTDRIPCKVSRKKNIAPNLKREPMTTGIEVQSIGEGDYYGFAVNKDHKFLLSDFTVTHNSYFVSQKIIYKMVAEKGHRYLACRKVKKDVRHSCYDLLKHTIRAFGFEDLFTFNATETIITCKLNGNDIIGVGLDDVDKLKSFFDPTDFWLEEADQATEADYNQLLLRLRGATGFVKQGMLSLNPIWAGHWIKKRFFDRQEENVITHRSTYRTNKFLDAATKKTLQSITDPYFKMVYAEGEWGVYGNVVFSNYIIEDFKYKFEDLENPFIGMDFGYNHASVIILGGFKDGEMYIVDELYGKGWTNAAFIEQAQEYFGDMLYDYKITADSAEPDRIEEWEKQGYHIQPAKKGPGSIRYGIDFLLRFKIHIHQERCGNAAREIQTFKRKEDREGNATDDFVELGDDVVAALRYGTEPYWEGGYFGKVADYNGFDMAGYLGL